MAKIILSKDGKVVLEMTLRKERVTIGRRPHNDIVINDPAVSAEHAVIVALELDSFLEDLNSTNGTKVNGQPVKKHFLQNEDVIELAQYRITYLEGSHVRDGNLTDRATKPEDASSGASQVARIRMLTGASAGREIILNKPITTIGKPAWQIVAIMLQPQGYSIAHVEGENCLMINDVLIGVKSYQLAHGDVIDLPGARMQFLLD